MCQVSRRNFEVNYLMNFRNFTFKHFRFKDEIQDIFKNSIFIQIMFSCIIICMTLFLLANQASTLPVLLMEICYLMTMVFQIFLFCWIGNELIYNVSCLKFTQKLSILKSFTV